jgi:hypothetical protein
MSDEDSATSTRRLRGDVDYVRRESEQVRVRSPLWPVLTVAVLLLFWPMFSPRESHGGYGRVEEYAADGEPVTMTGLWRALDGGELDLLRFLVLVGIVAHVVLVGCLALLGDLRSERMPLVVSIVAAILGAIFLVVVIGVHQDDGEGSFGREGYQPSGSWLLMMIMVAAAIGVATWIRSQRK